MFTVERILILYIKLHILLAPSCYNVNTLLGDEFIHVLTLFQLILVRQPLGGRLCPRTHVGGNLRLSGRTAHGSRLSELLVVFLPYRPQVPGGICHSHGLGLFQLPWITRSSQSMHELFTSYCAFSFKKLECH